MYDHPFHVAACRRLDLDPDAYGTPTAVARALGVRLDSYTRSLESGSLDTLGQWCGRLGIVMVGNPWTGMSYVATDIDAAREARAMVNRIVLLAEQDEDMQRRVADETTGALHALGNVVRWLEG